MCLLEFLVFVLYAAIMAERVVVDRTPIIINRFVGMKQICCWRYG